MKILVVEDEKISRKYMEIVCKMHGQCDIAEDGEEALQKIKSAFEKDERYDIVFLDIMLPKVTGHTVLDMIRYYEEEAGIDVYKERTIVIITSAIKDSETVNRAYTKLADGYIVKPIFKEKIEEVFEKYKK